MPLNKQDHSARKLTRTKPYAMVGAGRLASSISKSGDEHTGWFYRFNIFTMTDRGRVGQRFSPADLVDLVKLTRVLAATIAEDGCISPVRRRELLRLAEMLDQVIHDED